MTGATPLSKLRVLRAMHPGLVACAPGASLRDVARSMAANNIHALFVPPTRTAGATWRVITDVDLVAALSSGPDTQLATTIASRPAVFVRSADTLERAARLLAEHGTSHLVVLDVDTSHPIGVISTLDIASAVARTPLRTGPPRRRAPLRR